MSYKFLKCKNPVAGHIKLAFGKLLEEWKNYKCDCGYEFEGFIEVWNDLIPDEFPALDNLDNFKSVDTEAETKELPKVK